MQSLRSLIVAAAVAVVGCSANRSAPTEVAPAAEPVNAIAGDASWWARFGVAPPPRAAEHDRLRVHLAWVASQLAAAVPDRLSPEARARRAGLIEELRAYAAAGEFPQHTTWRGSRRPRFVDDEGRLCAVGHLIAHTAGRALAHELGARYEYAYLDDIDDPRLDPWLAAHGLDRREAAMIQPAYSPCDAWGRGPSGCAERELARYPWRLGIAAGGGIGHADGGWLSYFTWGLDLRRALTSYLAVGITDVAVWPGTAPDGSGYAAFTATPVLEISRWPPSKWSTQGRTQKHLDLGLTTQYVASGGAPAAGLGAQLALGVRLDAPDAAEVGFRIGATVALRDGYAADRRLSAGSITPFLQFSIAWRPN